MTSRRVTPLTAGPHRTCRCCSVPVCDRPSASRPVETAPSAAGSGFDWTERTGTRSDSRKLCRNSRADGCGEDRTLHTMSPYGQDVHTIKHIGNNTEQETRCVETAAPDCCWFTDCRVVEDAAFSEGFVIMKSDGWAMVRRHVFDVCMYRQGVPKKRAP